MGRPGEPWTKWGDQPVAGTYEGIYTGGYTGGPLTTRLVPVTAAVCLCLLALGCTVGAVVVARHGADRPTLVLNTLAAAFVVAAITVLVFS